MINWTNFPFFFLSLLRKKAAFKLCIFPNQKEKKETLEPYRSSFSLAFSRATTLYPAIEKRNHFPFEIIADISNYNLTEWEILSIIFNNNYFRFSLLLFFCYVHRSVNVSNFHFEMNYENLKLGGWVGGEMEFHFKNMTWIILLFLPPFALSRNESGRSKRAITVKWRSRHSLRNNWKCNERTSKLTLIKSN